MKLFRFSYLTGYIYILLDQESTFSKDCATFVYGLGCLYLIVFPQMNWLKTSKPIKKGGRIFWKCVVLIKKYIQWPLKSKPSTDNSFWPAIFAQADFYITNCFILHILLYLVLTYLTQHPLKQYLNKPPLFDSKSLLFEAFWGKNITNLNKTPPKNSQTFLNRRRSIGADLVFLEYKNWHNFLCLFMFII